MHGAFLPLWAPHISAAMGTPYFCRYGHPIYFCRYGHPIFLPAPGVTRQSVNDGGMTRGGGQKWHVRPPSGEDNRRGQGDNTSHTPDDPKGSADLREFVRTHVILAPGACGREVPSHGSSHRLQGIRWIRCRVPKSCFA